LHDTVWTLINFSLRLKWHHLHFCGSIDGQDDIRRAPEESAKRVFGLHLGPLRMVIMEYIDGMHGEALEMDNRPKDTHA
jgi:hypothetical protein